ncbi:unnamed protein product [Ixodes persulcatus]
MVQYNGYFRCSWCLHLGYVEDRTLANLFSLGRSTVNESYREFCRLVISILEKDWLKVASAVELPDRIRELQGALEFPQGIEALDGCRSPSHHRRST